MFQNDKKSTQKNDNLIFFGKVIYRPKQTEEYEDEKKEELDPCDGDIFGFDHGSHLLGRDGYKH